MQNGDGVMLRGQPGDGPSPGPDADQESVLYRSVKLRFPDLSGAESASAKAEALCDHIVATAIMRGELAQLRLEAHLALKAAMAEWNGLLPASTAKSGADLDRRRRDMRPGLAREIDDAKWTVARATEEMDRHGGTEYESASRAYTLLAGS